MNRRDFVKSLALLAAGAAALPEQIAAFERYYEVNTPKTALPLLAFDELSISGMATRSVRVFVKFFDGDQVVLPAALNAFGGQYFWRGAPDNKIVTSKLRWEITSPDVNDKDALLTMICGGVSYLDQDLVRHRCQITSCDNAVYHDA